MRNQLHSHFLQTRDSTHTHIQSQIPLKLSLSRLVNYSLLEVPFVDMKVRILPKCFFDHQDLNGVPIVILISSMGGKRPTGRSSCSTSKREYHVSCLTFQRGKVGKLKHSGSNTTGFFFVFDSYNDFYLCFLVLLYLSWSQTIAGRVYD